MTDNAEQRRQYISQVRHTLKREQDAPEKLENGTETKGMRVRFLMSVVLFAAFFCWHTTGVKVYEYTSAKVIDLIEENRYDKILQDYLKKGNIQ